MDKLYGNIRKRRRELKMTQGELAERMGYIDGSAVSRLERGEVDLPYSKVLLAAAVLEIDPAVLMGLAPAEDVIAELEELEGLVESWKAWKKKNKEAENGAL